MDVYLSRTLPAFAGLCLLLLPGALRASGPTFFTDNGLQQTVILDSPLPRGNAPNSRKLLRQEVLHLLGLHHRPHLPVGAGEARQDPRRLSAPSYMLDLYRILELQEEDPGYWGATGFNTGRLANLTLKGSEYTIGSADIIMSFINQATVQPSHEPQRRFYFDFSEVPLTEDVMTAELRLYKERVPHMKDWGPFRLDLYCVKQGADWEDRELVLESNMTVTAHDAGWILMNATSAAREWTYFSLTNYGLYLTVTDAYGYEIDASDIGIVDESGHVEKQAFLVAFFKAPQNLRTSEDSNRRSKRSASKPARRRDVTYADDYMSLGQTNYNIISCRKHILYVSFKELGWQDWIIAPEGYSAYYCEGKCSFPLNAHMNATNHAIVQTLVHLMNEYLVPEPCCAPTKLTAISVLYFDDNSNVILKKYKNMVVRACGCH